jgi:alanyl-tRNA synthetase
MDEKALLEIQESIKILDQKLTQLRDLVKVMDENTITKFNSIAENVNSINNRLAKLEDRVEKSESEIRIIEAQMKEMARVEDVKVIQKYLELIDPTRFLSKEDVIKIIRDYIEKNKWV